MSEQPYKNFHIERDDRGFIVVAIDVPDQSQNTFNAAVISELDSFVTTLPSDPQAKAVVFISQKSGSFFAGADVKEIYNIQNPDDARDKIKAGQQLFSKIEALPMPTIAAIHGVCLGGGLEFALACKYRIACDDSSTRMGLPEVELGILPGWGGTQRLPPLVGVQQALAMILQGKKLSAGDALRKGLVDQIASNDDFDERVESFAAEVVANSGKNFSSKPKRTWVKWFIDKTPYGRNMAFNVARKQIAKNKAHYPALGKAINAIAVGYRDSREAGFKAEQDGVAELVFTPTCRNLMGLFFQRERARSGVDWVLDSIDTSKLDVKTVAVIGGGVMGGGIAQLAAQKGYNVVLKEINQELSDKTEKAISQTLEGLVAKRRLSQSDAQATLARITFTTEWGPMVDADVAVEAVPEIMDLKKRVFADLCKVLPSHAIVSSNTSALSISEMESAVPKPSRIAGWHFFNPVHRMQLVEIVKSESTSAETIAQLSRLTKVMGKVPVVVKDSPGFLVNRVLMPYLDEGVRMLLEGIPSVIIDGEMRKFGMPMGPLELLDTIGIDVAHHVVGTMLPFYGTESPTTEFLADLKEKGQLGRKSGEGFYNYAGDGKPEPVEGLVSETISATEIPTTPLSSQLNETQQRLILPIINEAARCIDEEVVAAPWMADLAMVLGTGFAPFRGGPLKLVDTLGPKLVVQTLKEFEQHFDSRFTPAASLTQLAESNSTFFAEHEPGFEVK